MFDAVPRTAELERILRLPRRRLDFEAARELAYALTPLLRLPGRDAWLRPWQGVALAEAVQQRGLFASLPVGGGKTLVSWLLPYVFQAPVSWVVVPGGLREDTYTKFAAASRDWVTAAHPALVRSYDELTQVGNVDLLEREKPRLLILDESHRTRHPERSVPKRIARYKVDHYYDLHPVVAYMSGTIGRQSIRDYAHGLIWALEERAPIPLPSPEFDEVGMWARALDLKPERGQRAALGALTLLGGHDIDSARLAYQRRLSETPGVVIVDESDCDVPLTIRHWLAPPDAELEQHFALFRDTGDTPDGRPTSDAFSVYRDAKSMGSGILYYWDPPAPLEWMLARRAVCAFVRQRIEQSHNTTRPLDTEAAVLRAYRNLDVVKVWREVKPTFKPNSVAGWLSASVVYAAAEWVRAHPNGLVWVEHVPVARAIAQVTGVPFFGQGGKSDAGVFIEKHHGAAVLSLHANKVGRNLQRWNECLSVDWVASELDAEQLLGRCARFGQTRPVVWDVLMTCRESFEAFANSIRGARFVQQTLGVTQKILRATIQPARLGEGHHSTNRFGSRQVSFGG